MSAMLMDMGCMDFLPVYAGGGGGGGGASTGGGTKCLVRISFNTSCSIVISANSSSAALLAISRRLRRFRAFFDSLP